MTQYIISKIIVSITIVALVIAMIYGSITDGEVFYAVCAMVGFVIIAWAAITWAAGPPRDDTDDDGPGKSSIW